MTSSTNSIGVKLIAKGIDPKVDIIAVHGLHGDAYKTWTAKPETPDGEEVLWLRDLLPAEVPNARILAYGYDSDPGKVFESISTNMVHHHATTLVSELHFYRRREHERRRPIIFVCHSLGGIVVKRALIYSNTCNLSHNVHLRSIKVSTYGIIFLGTPHMGADLAKWGKMAEKIVRLVSPKSFVDSNNSLVKALEKNSETLQNITESFLGISRDFRQFFFWEELKTSLAGMGRELIVDYSSAVPEAYPDAGRAAIHATHSDMCKFRDENSPGWNVLAGCLCDFVEQAPSAIERGWAQEQRRNVLETQGYLHNVIRNTQAQMSSPHLLSGSRTSSPGGVGRIAGGNDILQPDEISEFGDFNYESRNASHNRLIKDTPFVKPLSLQENKYFEGREDELNTIHAILTDKHKRAVTISSVTGGGKTHLAREYFFHRKSAFPGGAFWIDCKSVGSTLSVESLDLGYCMIAEELGLVSAEHPAGSRKSQVDPKVATRLEVRKWFDNHHDWLLVLDGANVETNDEVNLLSEYVPKSKDGSILLTTLNWSFAGAARLGSPEPLELGRLTDEEAVRMVLHYSQIKAPSEAEVEASGKLVGHLEHNPLAIQSAGSYIKGKKVSISEYLRKYEKRPFVEREFLEPFHIIFDRLDARTDRYGEARNLLRLIAFLHREIPVQMLEFGVRHLPQEIKLRAKDANRRDLNNTIGHLLAYSLVDRIGRQSENVQIDTLVLNNVVQEVCISRLRKEPGELKRWLELAIRMYCSSFDAMELRQNSARFLVSDYRRYELHGVRLLEHANRHKVETGDLKRVLEKLKEAISVDSQSEGPRLSMFANGSGSDSAPETPSISPESSRRPTWDDKYRTISEPAQIVQTGGAQASLWKVKEEWKRLAEHDSSYDSDLEEESREPVRRSRRRHRPKPRTGDKPYKYRYEPPWIPRHGQTSAYSKLQAPHLFTENVTHSPQFNSQPQSPGLDADQTPVSTSSRAILQALLRRPSGFSSMDLSVQQPKWPWVFRSSRSRTPLRSVSPTPSDTTSQGLVSRTSSFPVSIIPPGTYSRGRSPVRRGRDRESLPNIHLHHPTAQRTSPRARQGPRTSSYDSSPAPHLIMTDHDAPPFSGSGDMLGYPQRITTPTNYQGKGGILDMPYETHYADGISKPRPFSPGFSPSRDLSSSPIARSIIGPRFDRPPSGAWSEPILEHDGDFSPQPSSYGSLNIMRTRPSTSTGGGKSPRVSQLQALASRGPGGRYSEPMIPQRSGSLTVSPEPSAHPMHRVVSEPWQIPTTRPELSASSPGLGIGNLHISFGSIPEVTIAQHTPDLSNRFGDGILEGGGFLRGEERRGSVPEAGSEVGSVDMQRSTSEPNHPTDAGLRRRSPGRENKVHND